MSKAGTQILEFVSLIKLKIVKLKRRSKFSGISETRFNDKSFFEPAVIKKLAVELC